jgi:hypothetical protein
LYKTFFTPISGSEAQPGYVDQIKAELIKKAGRPSVCFKVKPRVHIPWGLMYDVPPPRQDDIINFDQYSHFWCLKYQLSTVYDYLVSPFDFAVCYDANSFAMLTGVDSQVLKKAVAAKLHPTELATFDTLLSLHGQPIDSSGALLQGWQKREAQLGLLYLYCHASQNKIGFSIDDNLDTIDFKADYKKSGSTPRCLVFLNGCHTAAGDESGGFLEATGREGFCGFIGAETKVPLVFAFRFGLAFQALLYSGLSIVEIMERLYRQHWPLSLVYGLYAYPFLRLNPDPAVTLPALPNRNYSDDPCGSETV